MISTFSDPLVGIACPDSQVVYHATKEYFSSTIAGGQAPQWPRSHLRHLSEAVQSNPDYRRSLTFHYTDRSAWRETR
jgi:hypothetical protein